MYAWSTIRTLCVILLCIPLVHLAFLVSRDMMATLDASPEAWAHEVDAYALADQGVQLPTDPVVVLGGRRAKLWQGLDDLLSPRPVLMRGLGDATVEDILYYYERLAAFYRPSAVVFLPSDTEFHLRDSKSAQNFVAAVQQLAALDAEHGEQWQLILFTPIKTPLRPGDHGKINDITQALGAWAADQERVTVLDPNPLLAGPRGEPNPAFFRPDGGNLNEAGYLHLSLLVRNTVLPPI